MTCTCGGWSACPRCGVVELPTRFAGTLKTERDGLILVATDAGLQWFDPDRCDRQGDTVRGNGRLVPHAEVRREAQARAA